MAINTFMAQCTLQKKKMVQYAIPYTELFCACIDRLTKYIKRYFKHTDE